MTDPVDGVAIQAVLDCVQLTAPVSLEDVLAIRAALGDVPGLEVYHRRTEVVVEVRRAGEVKFHRVLPVRE